MYIVRTIKREFTTSEFISDESLRHLSNYQTFYLDSLQSLDEIRSRGFQVDTIKENQIFTVPNLPDLRPAAEVEREANWGAESLRVQEFWKLNARGQSVKVGIADTGIFLDHDCFKSLDLKEFIDINIETGNISHPNPYDGAWHGTHCAGVLCGLESDRMSRGVSPDIELYFAKTFDGWSGSIISQNKALEWFQEKQCDIVCLSLGWPGLHDDWADAMFKLVQGGAIVVAASGNEYKSQSQPRTRSPGNYPLDGLISVGAYNKNQVIWAESGGGIIDWPDTSKFSGKKNVILPYLVGPGVDIISCAADKGKYRNESGTSMATPHIAGIAANILSYIRVKGLADEKKLTKQILDNSIVDFGQSGPDERYGKGVLSIDKILAQLQSLAV
jgi:subtilisin family serine protease